MRSKKAIALIIATILIIMTLAATMVGCSTEVTNEDAFKIIEDAIVNSEKQNDYLVKENKFSTRTTNDTTEYRLNVHGDNPETTLVDARARFQVSYTTATAMSVLEYDEWNYGPSLSKDIKPKKAKDGDYKHVMFRTTSKSAEKIDTMTYKVMSMEEYFAIPEISVYTIKNVLNDLDDLDLANVSEASALKKGVSTLITFKVAKEGHAYNGLNIRVSVVYGKIAYIEALPNKTDSKDENAKGKFKIDITYMGSKLSTPSWDGTYGKDANGKPLPIPEIK